MNPNLKKIVLGLSAVAAGGTVFQSCGSLASFLGNTNPCGTILNCDPTFYEFFSAGYDGPGVKPDVDPFCTYPPFCPATVDPIFGQAGAGG